VGIDRREIIHGRIQWWIIIYMATTLQNKKW
jgi:hypothetical protein